jgi:hypothetical protein
MSEALVSASRLLRAVWAIDLTIAFCCVSVVSADTAGVRSVYVEPPEDHSGKQIESDVLGSLHDELTSALGKSQKVVAKPEASVLVHIEVVDFHMRNGASRWMLGAMSGKDYITSKVSLIDAVSNATLSSVEVKTSTANQYRGENSIARLHADEIAKALAKEGSAK